MDERPGRPACDAFVMGLSFPAASALVAGQDSEVGSRAGLILAAVNTVGAIVGTFLVPFAVIR